MKENSNERTGGGRNLDRSTFYFAPSIKSIFILMKTNVIAGLCLLLFFAASGLNAQAQTSLTSEAAKSFIDFYFNGQGQGVVLADMKICMEIVENECSEEVSPIALQQGVTYSVWMMFVVPQGDEIDDIIVQYNSGGITRKSSTASVKGSVRYRTWKSFTANRAGNWDIVVLHDKGGDVQTLKTITATVNE